MDVVQFCSVTISQFSRFARENCPTIFVRQDSEKPIKAPPVRIFTKFACLYQFHTPYDICKTVGFVGAEKSTEFVGLSVCRSSNRGLD